MSNLLAILETFAQEIYKKGKYGESWRTQDAVKVKFQIKEAIEEIIGMDEDPRQEAIWEGNGEIAYDQHKLTRNKLRAQQRNRFFKFIKEANK